MANNKDTEQQNKPYYHGHRQRLRTRFLEGGIDSLLEHEMLEFILFHSIPRTDTKPLAHRLIDSYGSLRNVFKASAESLRAFGISDTSVALIRFIDEFGSFMRKNEISGKKFNDYNEAGLLMVNELDDSSTERLVVLMLDSKDEVIGIKTVCEGSFRSAKINMKTLIQSCLDRNASKVIIAHNHPSGDIRPSMEDHVTTAAIENSLSDIDIELVEHYIVADGTYFGIKRNNEDARRSAQEQIRSNYYLDEE